MRLRDMNIEKTMTTMNKMSFILAIGGNALPNAQPDAHTLFTCCLASARPELLILVRS